MRAFLGLGLGRSKHDLVAKERERPDLARIGVLGLVVGEVVFFSLGLELGSEGGMDFLSVSHDLIILIF